MTLVLPADAKQRVPVMIMFGGGSLAQALGRPAPPAGGRGGFTPPPPAPGSDAPATVQLITDGWGFAFLNPASIQADNGAGLTKGIIGLVNKGQPRKPDDWGALRAWAWGASRALDYLETESRGRREARRHRGRVALRQGRARDDGVRSALRAGPHRIVGRRRREAASSQLGAKPSRASRARASITGWPATSSSTARRNRSSAAKNAGDIPVDAHELIALCAPRLTFVSYGVPEKGDAKWLDHQGSYMAAVAAQPVFRLLGAKDLGVSDDYTKEKMPPVNVGLLDGAAGVASARRRTHRRAELEVLPVVGRLHSSSGVHAGAGDSAARQDAAPSASAPQAADRPTCRARTDSNSMLAHRQLLAKRTQGKIDVYFMGNSIARRWGATDYPEFLANWKANFFGWNAADFGWGADRIEHMLWRIENGELDDVNPKVIVILAGTNNVGAQPGRRGEDRRHHARPPRARRPLPAQGAERDDHPHRHLSAQRQHGRHARRSTGSTRTSRASPTARRFATSTSTTSWPTRTASCSTG